VRREGALHEVQRALYGDVLVQRVSASRHATNNRTGRSSNWSRSR